MSVTNDIHAKYAKANILDNMKLKGNSQGPYYFRTHYIMHDIKFHK